MNESPASQPAENKPPDQFPQRRHLLILSIVGGVVLLLAAVILGVQGILRRGQKNQSMPAEVEKPTPTVSASPLPTPICEAIISSGDVEIAVALPVSLTVSGCNRSFPVEPIVPEQQEVIYPADRSGSATWLCGTVVNYVIGLEPTEENATLLTNLAPGEELRLRLASGAVLLFRFAERREVTAGEPNVLAQQQPRLTLILDEEGESWQVATADYVAESEPIESPTSDTSVQPGEPAQAGDVQVTVNKSYVERSEDLSAEMMYYLVEFSVENQGTTPLKTEVFSTNLKDSQGNTYLLSPSASARGENGPLSEEIEPGATAQGTAGYVVPDPLSGPLTWLFSPSPSSEAQASVRIPYQAEPEATPQPSTTQAEVTLTDAFLDDGDGSLIIEGEVRNTGTKPITVEASDISLSSSAGISELLLAAPQLPWTIESGQMQVIELQYERPEASTVLLELLGYSFEVGGL